MKFEMDWFGNSVFLHYLKHLKRFTQLASFTQGLFLMPKCLFIEHLYSNEHIGGKLRIPA